MAVRVTSLHVYPIKACRGIALESVALVRRGLEHDRRWMIVDAAGVFVTQREIPKLTLIETALDGDTLRVKAPGLTALDLPLEYDGSERCEVEVWGHPGQAVLHREGSRFISEYVGSECSLVFMPNDHERHVNPARARPEDLVSFADGYPLLLISEASLSALNERLATPVTMSRFRPNVVVSGASAFAEDNWARFAIGDVSFRGVKRCDRCSVTTVDPVTGERGKEPLATLAKFRLQDGKVWFGMNVIHDAPGSLRVGDTLQILDER